MEDCYLIKILENEKETTANCTSARTDVPTQHQSLGNVLSNFYQKISSVVNVLLYLVAVTTSLALASCDCAKCLYHSDLITRYLIWRN